MSLDQSAVVPLVGGDYYSYTIDQSLRFDDDVSAYLNRTPSSAGNRRTWTFSCWFKRGLISSSYGNNIFNPHNGGNESQLTIRSDDRIQFYNDGGLSLNCVTDARYRDGSSWYHLVVRVDTTQSTGSDRVRIYINGELQSVTNNGYGTSTPSQNLELEWNDACLHRIGAKAYTLNDSFFDGYMAEMHHVDGQSLDPSYFGQTGDYGDWKPKAYSGSYGTTGFYLDFAGTYYNDKSGNGNNWTSNGLATHDVLSDSPTNNFCVINALNPGVTTISNGSLRHSGTSNQKANGTIGFSSGKFYYEQLRKSGSGDGEFGVCNLDDQTTQNGNWGEDTNAATCWLQTGSVRYNNSTVATIGAFSDGDILMVAMDVDNNKVWFGKNGTWYNSGNPASGTNATISGLPDGTWSMAMKQYRVGIFNFGQDGSFAGNKTAQGNADDNGYGDFYYSPPSGFLALCTANLPDPDIIPSEYSNTIKWDGNSTNPRTLTGVGFQPDFVWLKRRNSSDNHNLFDAIRGAGKRISSNNQDTEATTSHFTAFTSDGFTVSADSGYNASGNNYVAWNWKANGSGSSNTNGTITSTVSAAPDAGFSIVTWTGTGDRDDTVGHGLSQDPEIIFIRSRTSGTQWKAPVIHIGAHDTHGIFQLQDIDALLTSYGGYRVPSSDVFQFPGNGWAVTHDNPSGESMVAYCWHSVPGYSKIGTYKPNQSTDGTYIYTGFRPHFVLCKDASRSQEWIIVDNQRDNEYNPQNKSLRPDSDASEGTGNDIDLLSNGFKIRTSGSGVNYASGDTMVYMAFAETPLKYANAR